MHYGDGTPFCTPLPKVCESRLRRGRKHTFLRAHMFPVNRGAKTDMALTVEKSPMLGDVRVFYVLTAVGKILSLYIKPE